MPPPPLVLVLSKRSGRVATESLPSGPGHHLSVGLPDNAGNALAIEVRRRPDSPHGQLSAAPLPHPAYDPALRRSLAHDRASFVREGCDVADRTV